MGGHSNHIEPPSWKFRSHFSRPRTRSICLGQTNQVVRLRIQCSISAATLKGLATSINHYSLWKHFLFASCIEILCMLLFIFRCSPSSLSEMKDETGKWPSLWVPAAECCAMPLAFNFLAWVLASHMNRMQMTVEVPAKAKLRSLSLTQDLVVLICRNRVLTPKQLRQYWL